MEIKELVALGAKLLKLSVEEAEQYSEYFAEEKALYMSVPVKGGASLLVAEDGSVLYANSSVNLNVHLREFRAGRRTPLEAFSANE